MIADTVHLWEVCKETGKVHRYYVGGHHSLRPRATGGCLDCGGEFPLDEMFSSTFKQIRITLKKLIGDGNDRA